MYVVYYVNGNIVQFGPTLNIPKLTWIKFNVVPGESAINNNEDVWIPFSNTDFKFPPDSKILSLRPIPGGLPVAIFTSPPENNFDGVTIFNDNGTLILTVDPKNQDWFDDSSSEEEEPISVNIHLRPTLASSDSTNEVAGCLIHYQVHEYSD